MVGIIFLIHKLPSVSSIGQAFHSKPSSLNNPDRSVPDEASNSAKISISSSEDSTASTLNQNNDSESSVDQIVLEDLTSQQKPISDFCRTLVNAKAGQFNQKEFGEAFKLSAESEKQDPRVQAIKPMLRYVTRLPKMTDMIAEAKAAGDRKDEDFFKKAEFYKTAFSAFGEMKEHQQDIESMMDRSYLFLALNNLVAHDFNFKNDVRIQNFCQNVELAFNQSTPVDYEKEKNDFLVFLNTVNVKPKEIGFDPDYKSKIQFNFSGRAMTFEGGWLSDLVKSDVELQADLKKSE